jgi:FtsZ-interacting cell division protein YlmF
MLMRKRSNFLLEDHCKYTQWLKAQNNADDEDEDRSEDESEDDKEEDEEEEEEEDEDEDEEEEDDEEERSAYVRPIMSSLIMQRTQIDLVDINAHPSNEFKYILCTQYHLSNFCRILPLTSKRASERG